MTLLPPLGDTGWKCGSQGAYQREIHTKTFRLIARVAAESGHSDG